MSTVSSATMTAFGDRLKEAMKYRGVRPNELNRLAGKDLGFASNLAKRENPRSDTVAIVARALRVRLEWLMTGQGGMVDPDQEEEAERAPTSGETRAKTLKDMAGWAEAFAEAVLRWRRIPLYTWEAVSMLSFENPPERVTPDLLLRLAKSWMSSVSDDDLAAAEEADIRRVMAEEDAAYEARMSPKPPMIETTHPGPSKAAPSKKRSR